MCARAYACARAPACARENVLFFIQNTGDFQTEPLPAKKAGGKRTDLAGTGGGRREGNCKLQIANCELRIADLQPPAGGDLFRVRKLARRPSMQSVCCASAPFSKSTSFQLRLVLDRVLESDFQIVKTPFPPSGGFSGRAGGIRTRGLLHPRQALYQAEPQPDF